MGYIKRNCDNCKNEYFADTRNLNRGWGKCCSKSCAAKKREKSKPNYNPERVASNNIKRSNWNDPDKMPEHIKHRLNMKRFGEVAPSIIGASGLITGMTSEGYRVMDGVAYDEWDDPIYDVSGYSDDGDSDYWDSKDYSL